MPLYYDHDHTMSKPVRGIPPRFKHMYQMALSRLRPGEEAAARQHIRNLINKNAEIHTSSWMPGKDWTGTPLQPLYSRTAFPPDEQFSGRIFGLMVFEEHINDDRIWITGRYELNGEPIRGRTYFLHDPNWQSNPTRNTAKG